MLAHFVFEPLEVDTYLGTTYHLGTEHLNGRGFYTQKSPVDLCPSREPSGDKESLVQPAVALGRPAASPGSPRVAARRGRRRPVREGGGPGGGRAHLASLLGQTIFQYHSPRHPHCSVNLFYCGRAATKALWGQISGKKLCAKLRFVLFRRNCVNGTVTGPVFKHCTFLGFNI